jgi:outer membrane protein assembly factor BamB
MKAWRRSLLILVSAAVCSSGSAMAQDAAPPQYSVQKIWHIGGPGRWDYATFDSDAHRLYVTRSTHTQGIDVESGKVVVDIQGQKRSHGTAIVTAAGRGFISDGEDGSIVVFDLKTGDVLGNVKADDDADGIIYDPGSDRVLTACGDAQKLIVLDPKADLKDPKPGSVDLGGKPEFLAADGAGKAYVNLNDQNQIAVVDIKNCSVTTKWPTAPGEKPTGLATDAEHHLLFVGCRNQKLIVMSTDDGHVVQDLPIGKGNDACKFNPNTGEAFASCGDGTITMVKQNAAGKFDASVIQTKPGARTMAVDPASHILYLPTAEMEAPPAGGGRPAMKPDTFMIVVVAPVK